jgi:putative tryptophan/tyrosine transport system substrate-binding protein
LGLDLSPNEAAAPVLGLKVQILKAGTDREIDAAFVSLVQARTEALLVEADPLFIARIERVVALAARHGIPTMYQLPEFVVAGGLISYGTSLTANWRQIGLYNRSHSQGRKARRPAGHTGHEIRAGHQSQDREGAWPPNS